MPNKSTEIEYNKLIRDKIPTIIDAEGNKAVCQILENDSQYLYYLGQKFIEEANEFASNYDISELADILELIHSVLNLRNITFKQLEAIRINKKKEHGGFDKRLVLLTKRSKH